MGRCCLQRTSKKDLWGRRTSGGTDLWGVAGQLYALIAVVAEYPEYLSKGINCQNFLHGDSSPMTSPPGVITLSTEINKGKKGTNMSCVTDTTTELQGPSAQVSSGPSVLSILQMSKLRPGKVKSPGIL